MNFIFSAIDTSKMSIGELSAVTTITGVVIVFAMLLLLVFMICVFGWVSKAAKKAGSKELETPAPKKEKKVNKKPAPKSAPVAVSATADDDEIIAVISAAVAMMYEGTGKTAVVRSIRPSVSGRSAWANAGIRDNVRAF